MTPFDPARIRHRPILSARLTLLPQRDGIGLAPDPVIFYTSHELLAALAEELRKTPLPLLSAAQQLHRLTLLFDAENISAVPETLSRLEAILLQAEPFRAEISRNAPFTFRCTLAIDFQDAPYCLSGTRGECIWLSPAEERLEKMSIHHPPAAPPVLITHALYEKLPPDVQRAYDTCWYIMHICCYGRSAADAE